MIAAGQVLAVADAKLEAWPLEPEQIVDGRPEVFGAILSESADGRVQRGIWEHTPGVSRDTEADELFVVISGRATIGFADGSKLDVGPGDAGLLEAGARTIWTVHETLRKVFQITT